jgi:small-conductance mechanosensitive channel
MQTIDLTTTGDYAEPIIKAVHTFVTNAPATLLFILIWVLVIRVAIRFARFAVSLTALQAGLRSIIPSILGIILWVLFLIQLLGMLGFKDIIVFFSSSVFAIGLLLSAGGSTLISDIVAGLFLARDEDFNLGDEVIVGETPTRGIIESMDARRIRLRDEDGVLHIIPNSIVERKEWVLVKRGKHNIAFVETAKRLRRAALDTRSAVVEKVEEKALVRAKKKAIRKNNQ